MYKIKDTYIDKDNLWLELLAAAAFGINCTENMLKGFTLIQLVLFYDMIILLNIWWIEN